MKKKEEKTKSMKWECVLIHTWSEKKANAVRRCKHITSWGWESTQCEEGQTTQMASWRLEQDDRHPTWQPQTREHHGPHLHTICCCRYCRRLHDPTTPEERCYPILSSFCWNQRSYECGEIKLKKLPSGLEQGSSTAADVAGGYVSREGWWGWVDDGNEGKNKIN